MKIKKKFGQIKIRIQLIHHLLFPLPYNRKKRQFKEWAFLNKTRRIRQMHNRTWTIAAIHLIHSLFVVEEQLYLHLHIISTPKSTKSKSTINLLPKAVIKSNERQQVQTYLFNRLRVRRGRRLCSELMVFISHKTRKIIK